MSGITKVFKAKTPENRNITMARPDYRSFRNISNKVSALMEVEFDIAMSSEAFEEVLQACTVENLDDWLNEADYQEVAKLWDAIIEFCEFESFFAERQTRHFEASKVRMAREAQLQVAATIAQVEAMKNSGELPESFSLESVMNAEMNRHMNLTNLPSSPITTPTSTDGPENESKPKTSGSSSGTTPKASAGGKRSKN